MRLALALLVCVPLLGQDRYPKIKAILQEAEAASAGLRYEHMYRDPHFSIADLYARAGYLDDAARALAASPNKVIPYYPLWRAHVVYGDLNGAEKMLEGIADPEKKAQAFASLADLLWRLGEPVEATQRFERTLQLLPQVANVEHRKRILSSIQQGLTYVNDEPPFRISATPQPRTKFNPQASPIPAFPITTDGFREGARDLTEQAKADRAFMKLLYTFVAENDRKSLVAAFEGAATPFQKALGLASMEHLLIQVNRPDLAESYAKLIPDADSETKLAKAEALSAAASAWLRADQTDPGRADFQAAVEMVEAVSALPFAKVTVAIEIAEAQYRAGLLADAEATLRQGLKFAEAISPKGGDSRFFNVHFREDGYSEILTAAVKTKNGDVANEVTELWQKEGPKSDGAIVEVWLSADRPEEALSLARRIVNPDEKASALLSVSRHLLDAAGAPNF